MWNCEVRDFCDEDDTKSEYVVQHDVEHGTTEERKPVEFPLSISSKQSMKL
jgi:hypothetical protein